MRHQAYHKAAKATTRGASWLGAGAAGRLMTKYRSEHPIRRLIFVYTVDEATGQLRWAGQESTRGETPRSFAIDPSGTFLLVANQDSDMVASFRIDSHTGMLRYLQRVEVPKPVCLKFRAAVE
jgi:6-phosphogluconolactonase (cycloisomerase 2 family)